MHLKQIKLAGFKSFVDPTILQIPSQLVAVVGPNGCGKSNIIDAVRWVMGESSAKSLRGESMADVIFSGSSQRKPVGQAFVELLFDSRSGRFGGQYAAYQELAVKRVVTRDGISTYSLNGTVCRRRDITDLFLGTGAGARSHAIIGQGMISKIIEGRPEELRAFFEEAAGTSKYKERRRETLVRLQHTKDNLARVSDIRDELTNQLAKLEKQAKTALVYQELIAKEQRLKAEMAAIKWQTWMTEKAKLEDNIQQLQDSEQQQAASMALTGAEESVLKAELEEKRYEHQNAQTGFYQLGTEIARLETELLQDERDKQRLEKELLQLEAELAQYNQDILTNREQSTASLQQLAQFSAVVDALKEDLSHQKNDQIEAKNQHQCLEKIKQEWQTKLSNLKQAKAVAEARLEALHQQKQDRELAYEKAQLALQNIMEETATDEMPQLLQIMQTLQEELAAVQQNLSDTALSLQETKQKKQTLEQDHREKQQALHRLRIEHDGLVAHINANQVHNHSGESQGLVIHELNVEEAWQATCEWILGEQLRASLLPEWSAITTQKNPGWFTLSQRKTPNLDTLASKMTGALPCFLPTLDTIFIASSLNEAEKRLAELQPFESIVTSDGFWLGHGWLKIRPNDNALQEGLLAKQAQSKKLKTQMDILSAELLEIETTEMMAREQLATLQEQLEDHQAQINTIKDALRTAETNLTRFKMECQQKELTKQRLIEQQEEVLLRLENLIMEMDKLQVSLEVLQSDEQAFQIKSSAALEDSQLQEKKVQKLQIAIEKASEALQQQQLQLERERFLSEKITHQLTELQQKMQASESQSIRLKQSLEDLNHKTVSKIHLDEQLAAHQQLEQTVLRLQEAMQTAEDSLKTKAALLQQNDATLKTLTTALQQQQLQLQSILVRIEDLTATALAHNWSLADLLSTLEAGASLGSSEELLQALTEKIKRLGAINLAAIEEYQQESERKRALEHQYDDLMEALSLLDTAIEKMDMDTELRFKTTFDAVNEAFQRIFPNLFGGGRAKLTLSCDNLLEAGVQVMAEPPGKRNSTIHLLSGGEKAMTAVALVFALFELNPSPFCMLDEVDAPLDEVNVGRFCALVKEMSQFVQFLFITHNKVTMELAEHLIGVTMKEPGVSRVVTVDIAEALVLNA